jgi:hypothetical protein
VKYDKKKDGHYLYTDRRNRDWIISRKSNYGSKQWAIKCDVVHDVEILDDAFWTRTSCVRRIKYLENPENEEKEIKKRKGKKDD